MATIVKKVIIVLIILVAIAGIGSTTHILADRYLAQTTSQDTPTCLQAGKEHKVTIRRGQVEPARIEAKLCDKLTITNTDDQLRLLAFGVHENHQAYDGVIEKVLQKNQSLTVTLNKTGTYRFHDHLDAGAQGSFTVTNS